MTLEQAGQRGLQECWGSAQRLLTSISATPSSRVAVFSLSLCVSLSLALPPSLALSHYLSLTHSLTHSLFVARTQRHIVRMPWPSFSVFVSLSLSLSVSLYLSLPLCWQGHRGLRVSSGSDSALSYTFTYLRPHTLVA